MHGQSTLKYLNDKAFADAILAKYAKDSDPINREFAKVIETIFAYKTVVTK
jgi:hypothetical protein